MAVSGVGLGLAAGGAFIAYAAITDQPPADALRTILKGQTPKPVRTAVPEWVSSDQDTQGTVQQSYTAAGGSVLALAALKYVGRPYRWGGNFDPPNGGGDCSGLIYRSYHDLGYYTPRLTSWQYLTWNAVERIPDARAGAILWYPGHVAIAVGQGNMVEAPTFGIPVRVVPIRRGYTALIGTEALSRYVYHQPAKGPF